MKINFYFILFTIQRILNILIVFLMLFLINTNDQRIECKNLIEYNFYQTCVLVILISAFLSFLFWKTKRTEFTKIYLTLSWITVLFYSPFLFLIWGFGILPCTSENIVASYILFFFQFGINFLECFFDGVLTLFFVLLRSEEKIIEKKKTIRENESETEKNEDEDETRINII